MKRGSLVSKVELELKALLQSDEFRIGDKIPTESVLCERFGVSRPTIREAQRSLQAQGFIEIRAGSGGFLTSKEGTIDNATNWFGSHSYEVHDYLEIRLALETLAVRLAVEHANEDDLFSILGIANLYERAVLDENVKMMAYYDEIFHGRIVTAAHNALLNNLMTNVTKVLKPFREQVFILNKGVAAKAEHYAIVEAMQERNVGAAEQCMKEHIENNILIVKGFLQ